jgi:hypothetical protein
MIDFNAIKVNPQDFAELGVWNGGYNKGLAIMADIFAEAIYRDNATIDDLKHLLQIIRLNSTPPTEDN